MAVLPLLVLAGLIAVFGYGLTRDPRDLPSALIEQPAPSVDLPGLPGRGGGGQAEGLTSADLRGQVTVVNFFASWCAPCVEEHPQIMALGRRDDIAVHGIAYRDEAGAAAAWLARHGDPYGDVGLDASGQHALNWGLTGVPETYILDAEGRIRYKYTGPISRSDLETVLRPVIGELKEAR
jgi:cytochrome c biogenesis protein CcmG/thiol:disulfide interchange protein DsbE